LTTEEGYSEEKTAFGNHKGKKYRFTWQHYKPQCKIKTEGLWLVSFFTEKWAVVSLNNKYK